MVRKWWGPSSLFFRNLRLPIRLNRSRTRQRGCKCRRFCNGTSSCTAVRIFRKDIELDTVIELSLSNWIHIRMLYYVAENTSFRKSRLKGGRKREGDLIEYGNYLLALESR